MEVVEGSSAYQARIGRAARAVRTADAPSEQARKLMTSVAVECIIGPDVCILLPPGGSPGDQRGGGPEARDGDGPVAGTSVQGPPHAAPSDREEAAAGNGAATGAAAGGTDMGVEEDAYSGQHSLWRRLGRPARGAPGTPPDTDRRPPPQRHTRRETPESHSQQPLQEPHQEAASQEVWGRRDVQVGVRQQVQPQMPHQRRRPLGAHGRPPPPVPPKPAAVIQARHSLSRALASSPQPDHLVSIFAQGLMAAAGPGGDSDPQPEGAADLLRPAPVPAPAPQPVTRGWAAGGGGGGSALRPGGMKLVHRSVQPEGDRGSSVAGADAPHRGTHRAMLPPSEGAHTAAAGCAGGPGPLSGAPEGPRRSVPPQPQSEPCGPAPPVPLVVVDPVCISAAVCRMARLEGLPAQRAAAQRGAHAAAAAAASSSGERAWYPAQQHGGGPFGGGALRHAAWRPGPERARAGLGAGAGWLGPEVEGEEGPGGDYGQRQQEQQQQRALRVQAFLRLVGTALRGCAAATAASTGSSSVDGAGSAATAEGLTLSSLQAHVTTPRQARGPADGAALPPRGRPPGPPGPLPPRPFRPREVANIVWGLSCLRGAGKRLCGSEADQDLLLGLAGQLLRPHPPAGAGAGRDQRDPGGAQPQPPQQHNMDGTGPTAPGRREAALHGPEAGQQPRESGSGCDAAVSDAGGGDSLSRGGDASSRHGATGSGGSAAHSDEGTRICSTGGSDLTLQTRRLRSGSESDACGLSTTTSSNGSGNGYTSHGRTGSTTTSGAARHAGGGQPGQVRGCGPGWRPGELAQLGWGMAHAGVVPPSRDWLAAYLAAWDEGALAAAAPCELAMLAWALATWHREDAAAEAGRRPAAARRAGGAKSERRAGCRGGRLGRRAAASAGAGLRVRSQLCDRWLGRFWAASGRHLLRTAAAAAAAAASGSAPSPGRGRGAPPAHAPAPARPSSHQPQGPGPSQQPAGGLGPGAASASAVERLAGGAAAAAAAPEPSAAAAAGPVFGPSELGMLLWSVAVLGLLPPRAWLEACLRAAAAAAHAAPPLALATTLLGAARLGRLAPVRAARAGGPGTPASAACAGAGGAEGGAVTPTGATAPQALPDATPGDDDSGAGRGVELPAQPAPSSSAGLPPGLSPLPAPTAPHPHHPPGAPVAISPPPARPPRPPPVPCQSLLAAFARVYLGRCASSLGCFGPSQVVDLLAALRMLSACGHMPPPAALPPPLSLPRLVDAAAGRLQRCYQQGLGARHLTAAAAQLAALRHTPPPEWLDWWMDEMYDCLLRRKLSVRELAGVLTSLASLRRTPGPTWTAALLAAARGPPLRRAGRTGLTQLAAALAGAGVRLEVAGPGAAAAAPPPPLCAAGGAQVGRFPVAAAAAGPPAGLAARRAWLRDFLCAWASCGRRVVRLEARRRGRPSGEVGLGHCGAAASGGRARSGRLQPPAAPTPEQAARLTEALTALAGPPAAWPPTLRAALELALAGRVLTRGLRRRLVERAGTRVGVRSIEQTQEGMQ